VTSGGEPFCGRAAPTRKRGEIVNAIIESTGKVGSRVLVGGHELTFDQPAAVPGGEDRGPSPLEVMVASVGACAHYFAAAYLHGRGLSTVGLAVEVSAEKERVPVSRIGKLAMAVRVPPGLDERQMAGLERAIKACPAYGTLLHPPSIELRVDRGAEIHPEPAPEAQTA
jgi:putative redox protein